MGYVASTAAPRRYLGDTLAMAGYTAPILFSKEVYGWLQSLHREVHSLSTGSREVHGLSTGKWDYSMLEALVVVRPNFMCNS